MRVKIRIEGFNLLYHSGEQVMLHYLKPYGSSESVLYVAYPLEALWSVPRSRADQSWQGLRHESMFHMYRIHQHISGWM